MSNELKCIGRRAK